MRILVAVDGSAYTKRMLGYLAAHDEWLGGAHAFTVLHVVPAVPGRPASALSRETLQSYYADEAARVLKPIRAFFARKPDLEVKFAWKAGQPAEVIAQWAGKRAHDLVLMGSHGHGGLANLLLGSVATKVLAHCKVPVLLVR